MQMFNYHTHTKRCGHAVGEDEEYIQAAIQAGFTTLGFSEHLGYEGWDDAKERIPFAQVNEYLERMREYQKKYKNQINLRIGFEFEYFPECADYLKAIKQQCDFMINGQHALQKNNTSYVHHHCSDDEVMQYANLICQAMASGLSDILAHPDYFLLGRKDFSPACKTAIQQIADCAKQYHVPIEVNLKGMKYGKHPYAYGERFIYPHREVFALIAKRGCDVVFGYDAHDPQVFLDSTLQDQASEALQGLPLHFLNDLSL